LFGHPDWRSQRLRERVARVGSIGRFAAGICAVGTVSNSCAYVASIVEYIA